MVTQTQIRKIPALIALVLLTSALYCQNKITHCPVQYNIISNGGEIIAQQPGPVNNGPAVIWSGGENNVISYDSPNSILITTQEISTFGRTYYDYQSNGSVRQLAQDPTNMLGMYAVFMVDPVGAAGYPDRRTRVFFSSNMGVSWDAIGPVPTVRSGYPSLDVLSDGSDIITSHSTDGGISSVRVQVYADVAPLAGSYYRLTPTSYSSTDDIEWGRISTTANISHTNKFFIVGAQLTAGLAASNVGTSLTSSTFLGWTPRPNIGSAEAYAVSKGSDGRIGIAYGNNDNTNPSSTGNVYFMQSTDDGVTFTSPVTVWQTNFNTDSMGCVRSVDICYNGNNPCVTFAVCAIDPASGGYFPSSSCKIKFWCPTINGGIPVNIDTCNQMTASNPQADVFYSDCRPVIGRANDSSALYVAWSRSRVESDVAGNNYFDVCFSYSINGGLNWHPRIQVTNTSGPIRDCRYVSISQSNAVTGGYHYAHLLFQMDSIPGSFVQGAQMSLAKMMYAKIRIDTMVYTGTGTPVTNVPAQFKLYQNYPNPFNPTTVIEFDLPTDGFVSLKVYNTMGQLISTIAEGKLSAGKKEFSWNAENFPSGVYFYTLSSADFTQTKKLVLIK